MNTQPHLSPLRHAELVSASMVPRRPKGGEAKWTLKQVQGDGLFWGLRNIVTSRLLFLVIAASIVTLGSSVRADATEQAQFAPIELSVGSNPISNIDGKGKGGSIDVYWRGNGNAWGYNLFLTSVAGEIAVHETNDGQYADFFQNIPHVDEDVVKSVRFAIATYRGVSTLHALVANRIFQNSVPEPAKTIISVYALVETDGAVGTTFQFEKRFDLNPKRLYCNADMALKTELNVMLPTGYSGSLNPDGCFD